jgi:hypothetical protein
MRDGMDATRIFTTEKAAEVLGLPEWRVVRFAQIKKYGISPAFAEAEGPGSRRLYNLENVCEMALASWLVQAGLRIEVIGRVIKQVRRTGGLSYLLSLDQSKAQTEYLGIIRTPRGRITGQEAVPIQSWDRLQSIFKHNADASLVIIPIGLRFHSLAKRLGYPEQKGD